MWAWSFATISAGRFQPTVFEAVLVAMAVGTALYGFLALLISFAWREDMLPSAGRFLATLGIWFASSLPVYMYFNPSWSHAHSAFAVALFLWYWIRTRHARTGRNGWSSGRLAALMMDVYYVNGVCSVAVAGVALRLLERVARQSPRAAWAAFS